MGTPPLNKPSTRHIRQRTRLFLYVIAGGRCEFDGCNKYLLEHPVTSTPGNFAEMAHIYAFSYGGPRGHGTLSPEELNDVTNLMLLCPACHKLIDDNPEEYTVAVLRKHKQAHEDRVYRLTGTAPDRHTTAIRLQANIGAQAVAITLPQMQDAVAPYYITRDIVEIDLTGITDQSDDAFWKTTTQTIQENVNERFRRSERVQHVSVFALAPMPLLVFLGSCLSNKVPIDLYQRHRDTQNWSWKTTGEEHECVLRLIQSGTEPARVALVLSLSGLIHRDTLPPEIDARFFIYEITLAGHHPNPLFMNQRQDLQNFRMAYQQFLRMLAREHHDLNEIHVFPAVPAPVAVACGIDLLPKVDPTLIIYDFSRKQDGFITTVKVNAYDKP